MKLKGVDKIFKYILWPNLLNRKPNQNKNIIFFRHLIIESKKQDIQKAIKLSRLAVLKCTMYNSNSCLKFTLNSNGNAFCYQVF